MTQVAQIFEEEKRQAVAVVEEEKRQTLEALEALEKRVLQKEQEEKVRREKEILRMVIRMIKKKLSCGRYCIICTGIFRG